MMDWVFGTAIVIILLCAVRVLFIGLDHDGEEDG